MERPILFRDELVRAILDGRKTVTRRVVKLHPPYVVMSERDDGSPWPFAEDDAGAYHAIACPFGSPGDVLYVRECFASLGDILTEIVGRPRAYRADADLVWDDSGERRGWWLGETFIDDGSRPFKWTPSIHMPRWASRLTLRVTDVRVERLQDITEEDAIAEGVTLPPHGAYYGEEPHGGIGNLGVRAFACLWNSLAKPGATWADNPWVWRIAFERGEGPTR